MDDAVVVALFRHGVTEENKRHAYIGWTDAPLCEDAIKGLAKHRFETNGYQWLLASDLQRCVQTAEILFPGRNIHQMPEFREMNFGSWEGKVYEELSGDPAYKEWLESWLETEIPGGESAVRFNARVQSGWEKVNGFIVQSRVATTAIVTHGGVIRYLLSQYGDKERHFWDWKIPHGSGFELIWNDWEAFRRGERCILLREVPLTESPLG
nr:histidine phosphatase family protein [uncultured Bacillus sp.]